jgi:hypothetical protein
LSLFSFGQPKQNGCPILRVFGEGWDVQIQPACFHGYEIHLPRKAKPQLCRINPKKSYRRAHLQQKTERKGHKVKRKHRHGTLCTLSETLASFAFSFHNRFTADKSRLYSAAFLPPQSFRRPRLFNTNPPSHPPSKRVRYLCTQLRRMRHSAALNPSPRFRTHPSRPNRNACRVRAVNLHLQPTFLRRTSWQPKSRTFPKTTTPSRLT